MILHPSQSLPTIPAVEISPEELGRRLRAKREETGMSGERLGNLAGLTGATVSRLERGETYDTGYRVISRLAIALGLSGADELLGEPLMDRGALQEPFDELEKEFRDAFKAAKTARKRRSIDPIEQAIRQAEQDAPESATIPASRSRKAKAQPDEGTSQLDQTERHGTGNRAG